MLAKLCPRLRPPLSLPRKASGGAEENAKVEMAAMRRATRYMKAHGWMVKDVSAENRGYDLLCTKRKGTRHVEVKGISGEAESFILTAKEAACAAKDANFLLLLVRRATTPPPKISTYSGAEVARLFSLRPLGYMATRRR